MSHRFKAPKMFHKEGSERARMIRYARQIRTQEELDRILAKVPPMMARAFLVEFIDHLPFEPMQMKSEPVADQCLTTP